MAQKTAEAWVTMSSYWYRALILGSCTLVHAAEGGDCGEVQIEEEDVGGQVGREHT